MENEVGQTTYPLVSRPEAGTVLYPFRRMEAGNSTRIARAFFLRLREWLPEEIVVADDVWVNMSEKTAPVKVEIALLMEGRPDFRIDVEVDVPYTTERKPVHYKHCGDGYRDALMTRHGWTVVRYAGSQLLDNPKACADFLLALDDDSLRDKAEAALKPVFGWTRTEALKQAARGEGYPEEPVGSPLLSLTAQEHRCQPLVKPFARSREMSEKMAGFTDAGRYEQDAHIDFEPTEHVYLYQGRERLLPVSCLIAHFFEPFDALTAAERQWQYKGIAVEESLDTWEKVGRMASEVGTFVHAQTERYFREGIFESVCPFCHHGETQLVSVEREKQHFLHFIGDYGIRPYRQEWPVYDRELNIAGTIDLICRDDDGEFTIYDWKRSGKVVNPQGQPVTESFGGRMSLNGIRLPDTAFYHYCVQQNLYRYMLERHYGVKVRAMNLVVLCPDYPTYYVAQVPKMDEVIGQIVAACHREDLGHRLI